MKVSSILGLNARATEYSYRYNTRRGKAIAASKALMAKVLKKEGIPTPKIYKKIATPEAILKFDWHSLPDSFAVKPSRGLGGKGIIVIKRRAKDGSGWITTTRERVSVEDLKLHALDILEGAYSLSNTRDIVLIQEYVGRHKAFKKYAYRGTPDIRVIVFNKVPVMAMARFPTKDSGGRSNLHQGAIGVGVDIATGITTKAIQYTKHITHKPGTKRKLNGIKIPHWNRILTLAVEGLEVTGLVYGGVDIMIHPEEGPMIIEFNYQPGLQIQLANMAGLRKRLDRVEDLKVIDAEHGVTIAKTIFAGPFARRVRPDTSIKTISALEEITIKGAEKGIRKKVIAKIDTGAWRTSISQSLAEELGLLNERNVLWTKTVRSSLGREKRPVISLTFWLAGTKVTTPASVAKRMALKYPVIVGRKNLKGFLVNPHLKVKDVKEARKKSDEHQK
jgi:alpha-L-glutamate ligase-like protein